MRNKSANAPKHLPPPVTVQQIRQEKANFDSIVNPIINKPIPKAPTPPKENNGDSKSQSEQETQQNQNENNPAQEQQQQQQQRSQQQQNMGGQENMEWQTA